MNTAATQNVMRASGTGRIGLVLMSLASIILALASGCADTGGHDTGGHDNGAMHDRQDAAMKDPFSYGPGEGKTNAPTEPGATKRDDSLKGQSDRFWNP